MVLMFGGAGSGRSGGTWTHLGSEGPSARSVHVMAFDHRRGRLVLFGGAEQRERLGDTWLWDGTTWTRH